MKRFKEKLDDQSVKIIELQSKIAIQDNALQKLEIKYDGNEQYRRRSWMRIHAVEYNENDDINIKNKVERRCDEIGVKFDSIEIVRSIIVKFKSWESRKAFYKARPRNFIKGRKKPDAKSFSISLDLTKRRSLLLTKAKGAVKDNPSIVYDTPFVT